MPHRLIVGLKGFADEDSLYLASKEFEPLKASFLRLDDDRYDIGAYVDAAESSPGQETCFLNSHSEIVAEGWLERLYSHLCRPHVGLVGATASFEAQPDLRFPIPHIRSNAFMISNDLLCSCSHDWDLSHEDGRVVRREWTEQSNLQSDGEGSGHPGRGPERPRLSPLLVALQRYVPAGRPI